MANRKSITAGTIARTICLALALINQLMVVTGHSVIPIEDHAVETLITEAFTVAAALVAWWKNNSFTQEAIECDELLHEAKAHRG